MISFGLLLSLAPAAILAAPSTSFQFERRNLGNNGTCSGTNCQDSNPFNLPNITGQILNWVVVVAVIFIVAFSLLWRYNRVKRTHKLTWRTFFLPANGIAWLKIAPVEPIRRSPDEIQYARRARRSRRTTGADIGVGGQRQGGRDIDDLGGEHEGAEMEELPEYKTHAPGLPQYESAWFETHHPASEDQAGADSEQMMSVEEYERQTRQGGTAAAAGANETAARGEPPTYEIPPGTELPQQPAAALLGNSSARSSRRVAVPPIDADLSAAPVPSGTIDAAADSTTQLHESDLPEPLVLPSDPAATGTRPV